MRRYVRGFVAEGFVPRRLELGSLQFSSEESREAFAFWLDAVSILGLELGLRWLHDRASERRELLLDEMPFAVELRMIWLEQRLRLARLELGLRWLHDKASGRHRERLGAQLSDVFIGFVRRAGLTTPDFSHPVVDALELGLRWLHDRTDPRCETCKACGYPAAGHRFANPHEDPSCR